MDPVNVDNYGFVSHPLNIVRDRNVFIDARAALREDRVVVCDVDFVLDRKRPEEARYVSASFFAFQQAVKAKLYFGYTNIGQDGQIECVILPSRGDAASAEEAAQEFIDFIDKMQGEKSGIQIGVWRSPAN
ncbi:hypothetical protein [Hyphomicrobium sp. 99]|uniref:hypothetical protein n=1 Tax=Hyphomicrobium sp. 99 TaxID=1163419 RepID=UPI0012E04A57|nr:hypothetical protein [Hyphomicrobium sp. 99]